MIFILIGCAMSVQGSAFVTILVYHMVVIDPRRSEMSVFGHDFSQVKHLFLAQPLDPLHVSTDVAVCPPV